MDLDPTSLRAFEDRLGHTFRHSLLFRQAITHRSLAHEMGGVEHYERLEFLGDAVLGLVAAEWLFRERPDEPEGILARTKSYVVSAPVLASYAETLDLGRLLLVSSGEEQTGGREKPSLLADSLEAVFGAVFLDAGLDAARKVIRRYLDHASIDEEEVAQQDSKTVLQELVQSLAIPLPEYRLVEASGPDHAKRFAVECWVDGSVAGQGEGPSKKLAEQRAAAAALTRVRPG